MMRTRKKMLRLVTLAGAFILIFAIAEVQASSSGISGRSQSGAVCHGITPDPSVTVTINGIPTNYVQGNTYPLVISVFGGPATNFGGFDLSVTGGTLTTSDPNAQIMSGEATHTNRNARSWNVDWQAPSMMVGTVTFFVAGNAVNGDGGTTGDGWNVAVYTSDPAAPNQNPAISISSPDGTQDWTGGTQHTVAWSMNDDSTPISNLIVFLNYSSSSGSGSIAGPLVGATNHLWDVPLIDATDAKVNATVIDGSGLKGYSEVFVPKIDSTAPTVQQANPSGLTVPINAPIVIQFSETMHQTATEGALSIAPTVSGLSYVWSQTSFQNDTLTVNHDPFTASTQYTVTVSTGARDISDTGNFISTQYQWQFNTSVGADTTPPTISAVTTVPGIQEVNLAVNVSALVQDDSAVGFVWLNVTPAGGSPSNATMTFDTSSGRRYLNQTYSTPGIHSFVIWASDTSGNWASASGQFTMQDTSPPATPTGLTVQTEGSSALKLTWDTNSEPDVAGYRVYRSLTQGGPYVLLNPSALVSTTTYTDSNLEAGTIYYYIVTAVDTSDNESNESNEASGVVEGAEGTGGAAIDWIWIVLIIAILIIVLLLVMLSRRKGKTLDSEPEMEEGTRQY